MIVESYTYCKKCKIRVKFAIAKSLSRKFACALNNQTNLHCNLIHARPINEQKDRKLKSCTGEIELDGLSISCVHIPSIARKAFYRKIKPSHDRTTNLELEHWVEELAAWRAKR